MSLPKIKDLVSIDEKSMQEKAVQLDLYTDEKRNLRLCREYRFSSGVKYYGNKISTVDLLRKFKDNLLDYSKGNKHIIISGYGKGKTHFALVVANYFSRKTDSIELAGVYEALEKSHSKEIAEDFKKFKESGKAPQLVIRLKGDSFFNLHSGFLNALKEALSEEPATKDYQLPDLCSNALAWCRVHLDKNQRKKADKFLLSRYKFNLTDLEKKLEKFSPQSDIIAVELCKYLFHITPDFGSEVNLESVITRIFNDLCSKPGDPYHKIVILFDELGAYIDNYRLDNARAGIGALKEITDACDNLREKICFICFTQKEQLDYSKEENKDDITKFLNSIKKENRFFLAPDLELVLNRMIARTPLVTDLRQNVQVGIVSYLAYLTIPYYRKEGWNEKLFLDTITMSFYPLHPVTTGLICRLDFARGRSIIDFISEKIKAKLDEPSIVNLECKIYGGQIPDVPNWIHPYEIVDYFEENFRKSKENKYDELLHAMEQIGSNAPQEVFRILKSLFLYYLARLDKGSDHAKTIGLLSGIEHSTNKHYLKELEDNYKVIHFHEGRKEYDFYTPGTGLLDVYKRLDTDIEMAEPFNSIKLAEYINNHEPENFKKIVNNLGLEATEFTGARNLSRAEYVLKPLLVSPSGLTGNIKQIYENLNKNIIRGLIFYCISEVENELSEARKKAQELTGQFKSPYGGFPLPVIFGFPDKPIEGLSDIVLRLSVLNAWSSEKSNEYGEGYKQAKADLEKQLKEKLQTSFEHLEFITHQEALRDLSKSKKNDQKTIINKLFEICFPYRPSLNYSTLKTNSGHGKKYVGLCSRYLCNYGKCDEELDNLDKTIKSGIQNIIEKVLQAGNYKWGTMDNNKKVITPNDTIIKRGWHLLDKKIENGKFLNLYKIYETLQEPPFGYDDLTFTLLLASWMGFNRNELEIFSGKDKVELDSFCESFEGLNVISKSRDEKIVIRKLDTNAFTSQVKQIKEALKVDIPEYDNLKILLEHVKNITTDKRCLEDERRKIKLLSLPKEEKAEKVDKFFSNLELLEAQLKESLSVIRSCKIRKKIKNIIFPQNINYSRGKYNFLSGECDVKIEKQLKQELVDLPKIEDYTHLKNNFEEIKKSLKAADLPNLVEEVDAQLVKLEEQYQKIQLQEEQYIIFQKIKSLPPPIHMAYNEVLKNLDIINSAVKKIDIESFKKEAEKKCNFYVEQLDFLRKQISEIEEKIHNAATPTECQFLQDKINEQRKRYKDSRYEDKFPELSKILEEKKKSLEEKNKIAEKNKTLLQEFSYLKTLAEKNRDTIMIYNFYCQMNNIKLPSDFLDKSELKQIEKEKKFVLKKFSNFIKKELSATEITKKSDYQKKKSRLKDFEKKIKPVGKIDKGFISLIKDTKIKLNEEYLKWKSKQKKEKIKKDIEEKINQTEYLPTNRMSFCNQAIEKLSDIEKNLPSEFAAMFKEAIGKQHKRIEDIKLAIINRVQIYKKIIEDISEVAELTKIKEELLRIQYIFDDPSGEKEFHGVFDNLEKKLIESSKKVDIKQLRNILYSINETQKRVDFFVKLFQSLAGEEQKMVFELIKNMEGMKKK